MMQIVSETSSLRKQILEWRREGQSIALIPTKGDIHEGHIALIKEAAEQADIIVVSIFVNHLEQDSIDTSTQMTEQDLLVLKDNGVTLVFTPSIDDMVPTHIDQNIHLNVPHFRTMIFESHEQHSNYLQVYTTTICKLFNLIQPDYVCVGETDVQRLSIIHKLVNDLCFPIKIISAPIVRELDGLVASRHNKKLTVDERQRAPVIAKTLRWASGQIRAGRKDYNELILDCKDQLRAAGLVADEILICDANNFHAPQEKTEKLVIFASVKLSNARLIDNLVVDLALAPAKQIDDEE